MRQSELLRRSLLDGRYRWGIATRRSGRYGSESIHLRIYQPETSTADRRLARVARLWPPVAAVLVFIVGLVVPAVAGVPAVLAFGAAAILAIAIGATLSTTTAAVRAPMAEAFARKSLLSPQESDRQLFDDAEDLLMLLDEAERAFDLGEIAWSTYHQIWAGAYRRTRTGSADGAL